VPLCDLFSDLQHNRPHAMNELQGRRMLCQMDPQLDNLDPRIGTQLKILRNDKVQCWVQTWCNVVQGSTSPVRQRSFLGMKYDPAEERWSINPSSACLVSCVFLNATM
jgi:hypothetical protein